jgi:hypothetical protein
MSGKAKSIGQVPVTPAGLAKMQGIAIGCRKDVAFDRSIEAAIGFRIACRGSFDKVLILRWGVT